MRRGRADSVCVCGVRGGGDRSLNAYLQWKEIVKLSKEISVSILYRTMAVNM